MKPVLLLDLIVFYLFAGCTSKIYFTDSIRNRLENADVSLQSIQYYSSKKLDIRKELETGKAKVKSGKVKLENGKYIQHIYLSNKTPGVCKTIGEGKLGIAFEQGEGKILNFGQTLSNGDKNPFYQINAIAWEKGAGKILYDGDYYYIQPSGSDAKLQIKRSALKNKTKVKARSMKGIRVK